MPDIAMCANPNCPLVVDCRRSEASGTKPGDWPLQSWMAFKWTENEAGVPHCDDFLPVRRRRDTNEQPGNLYRYSHCQNCGTPLTNINVTGMSDGSSIYAWRCGSCGHEWLRHSMVRGDFKLNDKLGAKKE